MASTNVEEILEKVSETTESEAASDEKAETTETEVEAVEAKESTSEGKPPKTVPYSRVKELSGKVGDLSKKLEASDGTVGERDAEIKKLVDLLELREGDTRVLQKIQELHEDPRYTNIIDTLDKAVQGVHEAQEQAEEAATEAEDAGDTKALSEIKSLQDELKSLRDELSSELDDQNEDRLVDRYESQAEAYFAQLVDEYGYNEDDVRVLREGLVDRVDWDTLKSEPEGLDDIVANGLTETLKWYGTPRGALGNGAESDDNTTTNTGSQTAEERLEKIMGVDWGKVNEVGEGDNKKFVPEVSEDDFGSILAETMRITRNSSS